MEILKYDGETEDELIYRVCSMKEAIGTWKDVSEVLNELLGYEYDESCYRKNINHFKKYWMQIKTNLQTEKNKLKN